MTKLICLTVACLLLAGGGIGCNKTIREAGAHKNPDLKTEV